MECAQENSIGSYLLAAYRKHKVNNFTFKLICICFDEDCNKLEQYYISKFNTIVPNGYNLKEGGAVSKHHSTTIELMNTKAKEFWTKERREQQSKKYSGINHPNYGKYLSDDRKKEISIKQKEYWSKLSSELKDELISNRIIKRNNTNHINTINNLKLGQGHNSKRVGQYDLQNNLINIYESTIEASNKTSICLSSIGKVCRGVKKYITAGGYIWKYI